jgi:hypothetical protein
MFFSFWNIFVENLTKEIFLTIQLCYNSIGQQMDQSSLDVLVYPKISCVQSGKYQFLSSFVLDLLTKQLHGQTFWIGDILWYFHNEVT